MGPGLDQRLLSLMEGTDEKVQEVIIQILGELGDKTCIPVFEEFSPFWPSASPKNGRSFGKIKIPSWPSQTFGRKSVADQDAGSQGFGAVGAYPGHSDIRG